MPETKYHPCHIHDAPHPEHEWMPLVQDPEHGTLHIDLANPLVCKGITTEQWMEARRG